MVVKHFYYDHETSALLLIRDFERPHQTFAFRTRYFQYTLLIPGPGRNIRMASGMQPKPVLHVIHVASRLTATAHGFHIFHCIRLWFLHGIILLLHHPNRFAGFQAVVSDKLKAASTGGFSYFIHLIQSRKDSLLETKCVRYDSSAFKESSKSDRDSCIANSLSTGA